MKIFVIMGNDFPDRVFADEAKADAFCKEKMDEQRVGLKPYEHPRIYWRSYEFEVIE